MAAELIPGRPVSATRLLERLARLRRVPSTRMVALTAARPHRRENWLRRAASGAAAVALTICLFFFAACGLGRDGDQLAHPLQWGVFVPDVLGFGPDTTLQGVRTAVGRNPYYVHRFAALNGAVAVAELDAVAALGGKPLITIEPWEPGHGVDQPEFALNRIASGAFDDQLRRWGRELGRWHKPVLLRFAHEMNGSWYPWSVGVNGNTAHDYRDAWRRLVKIISALAPNVEFVWAPNVITAGIEDFEHMYPGADTVDYLGLDGYNWGDQFGAAWRSPNEVFEGSVMRMNEIAKDKPILITEVASTEDNRDPERKAEWISDLIESATKWPNVVGFVWFQTVKERDWRFTSSPNAVEAFRTAVSVIAKDPPG